MSESATLAGNEIKEFPVPEIRQPTEGYAQLIDSWIFNEDYRNIMRRKLIDGRTYEQIATETGMSAHGVFDIVKECTEILIKHI